MSEKSLRNKLIRLAHSNPELREHLLPLITKESNDEMKEVLKEVAQDVVPGHLTYGHLPSTPLYKGMKPLTLKVVESLVKKAFAKGGASRDMIVGMLFKMGYKRISRDLIMKAKLLSIEGIGKVKVESVMDGGDGMMQVSSSRGNYTIGFKKLHNSHSAFVTKNGRTEKLMLSQFTILK